MQTFALQIGDKAMHAAPLTLGAFKRAREALRSMEGGGFDTYEDLFGAMTLIVWESARRVNPALTLDELQELLDFNDAKAAMHMVLQASVPPPPPGELTAGSPSGESIGTP